MSERVLAIDVETATATRESMCSLGIATFQDGRMVEQRYWMVRPPNNYYDAANIAIHGIQPAETENAPMFRDIWNEVRPYFDSADFLIAHNAGFDMTVMRSTLGFYGLEIPDYKYGCTYVLSNRLLGAAGKGERRLNTLCGRYSVPLYHHHDASEDSVACGKMVYEMILDTEETLDRMVPEGGFTSLSEAFNQQGLFKSMYRSLDEAWAEGCRYRDEAE